MYMQLSFFELWTQVNYVRLPSRLNDIGNTFNRPRSTVFPTYDRHSGGQWCCETG